MWTDTFLLHPSLNSTNRSLWIQTRVAWSDLKKSFQRLLIWSCLMNGPGQSSCIFVLWRSVHYTLKLVHKLQTHNQLTVFYFNRKASLNPVASLNSFKLIWTHFSCVCSLWYSCFIIKTVCCSIICRLHIVLLWLGTQTFCIRLLLPQQ